MHIALATCSKLPDCEVDDAALQKALADQGVEAAQIVWDDPQVDWSAFDGVLIRTTWDYMEKRQAFIAWAEHVESVTRLFNSAAIVLWNTHKKYLRDLESAGIPVVPTVWLEQDEQVDVRAILAEQNWSRAFIKPAIGGTARETLRFHADDDGLQKAQSHIDRLLAKEDILLQPYLSSVETEGEISAIFIEGEITHCVRKIPVSGDYRVQDNFGATDEPIQLTSYELALVRKAHEMVDGDLLYARVDFLRDDEGNLRLTEFEAVEPSLFFRHSPHAAIRLSQALCSRLG